VSKTTQSLNRIPHCYTTLTDSRTLLQLNDVTRRDDNRTVWSVCSDDAAHTATTTASRILLQPNFVQYYNWVLCCRLACRGVGLSVVLRRRGESVLLNEHVVRLTLNVFDWAAVSTIACNLQFYKYNYSSTHTRHAL